MKVFELKELLEDLDDFTEVRWASQPGWAFEYSIESGGVTEDADAPILYLAEGNQIGYLPAAARKAVGWSTPE